MAHAATVSGTVKTIARELRVFDDAAELMRAAAEAFVESASAAIRERGRFLVALSGGSTPNALYDLLAGDDYRERVEWPRVEVFWGDERCVPLDDPASNYRAARERLLDRVPVRKGHVHPIGGGCDPNAGAAAYEGVLRVRFATPTGPPSVEAGSRFDLVLLGLGADGHTASLFPGTAAIDETTRWAVALDVPGAAGASRRITLTPIVLNAAAEVLFLVVGRDKAEAMRRVLTRPFGPRLTPARAIVPRHGRLRFYVDAGAAA
jgi:6-phosphogluconolactonase